MKFIFVYFKLPNLPKVVTDHAEAIVCLNIPEI